MAMGGIAQWGPLDYHRQSLRNLQAAVRQARQLCAVIVDIAGRELTIERESTLDEKVQS